MNTLQSWSCGGLLALAGILAQGGAFQAAAQTPGSGNSGAPYGMVTYYTATTGQNGLIACPSGWTAYQPALGYMILATTDPTQYGQTQGTAMSGDKAQPAHVHPVTLTAQIDSHESYGGGGSHKPYAQSGSFKTTGVSNTGTTGYGFIQFVICEATTQGVTDTMPLGTVAYFDAGATNSTCPANWGPLNAASGYFVMAGDQGMTIGTPSAGAPQSGNSNWNVNTPFPTHTHPSGLVQTLQPPPMGMDEAAMGGSDKAMDNPIQFNATLGANPDPVVPAIAMMICQKSTGPNTPTGFPPLMSFYYSSTTGCPPNSGPAIGAGGNFVLGIPEGGNPSLPGQYTQGAVIGTPLSGQTGLPGPAHVNPISMTVDIGDNTTKHYGSATTYAQGGSYTISGYSAPANIQLPYIPLLLCTYNG